MTTAVTVWGDFDVPAHARGGQVTLNLYDHLAAYAPKRPGAYLRISSDRFGLEAGVDRQLEDAEDSRSCLRWGPFAKIYRENDTSASKSGRSSSPTEPSTGWSCVPSSASCSLTSPMASSTESSSTTSTVSSVNPGTAYRTRRVRRVGSASVPGIGAPVAHLLSTAGVPARHDTGTGHRVRGRPRRRRPPHGRPARRPGGGTSPEALPQLATRHRHRRGLGPRLPPEPAAHRSLLCCVTQLRVPRG